jgi:hypothetical protein
LNAFGVNSLGQLFFEFIEQNGSYLVFFREDGIRSADLNALQVRMLRQNNIERLLPIEFDETDMLIRLRYRISDTKMLSQVLQYRRLTMPEYYDILLKTVHMLSDCKTYMLDEEKHILHESFIFVGEDLTDVRFVYLPTEYIGLTGSIPERLKQLATTLIAFVDGMDAAGFQSILQYFYTQSFTLAGFRDLLHRLELHTGHRLEEQGQPGRMSRMQEAAVFAGKAHSEEQQPDKGTEAVHETHDRHAVEEVQQEDPFLKALAIKPKAGKKEKPESKKAAKRTAAEQGKAQAVKQTDSKKEGQIRSVMLAVLAVGAILTVKALVEKEGAGLLSLSLLLLAASGGYLLKKRFLKPKKPGPAGSSEEPSGTSGLHPAAENNQSSGRGREPQPVMQQGRSSSGHKGVRIIGPEVPTEHYYDILHLYTSMLGEGGEHITGNLGFDNTDREEEKTLSFLIVQREGQLERIAIHKDVFRIGSQEDAVHYCESSEGVSRVHMEIINKSGKNVVKDLGSRNGTFLNGDRLAPYREYMLEDEDKLFVAQSEFQFFYSLKGSTGLEAGYPLLSPGALSLGGEHEAIQ